ncbi:MAG: hypothetical protein HFI33_12765 [Lachnospiraceae bacterium]|nr:hypothetical protein [Lachnospiraceae bacterium]
MGIVVGGIRIILGIALVAAGIFLMYVKAGGFGGFLCGIGIIIAGNLKGFETVAAFFGVESSTFDMLFTMCLLGAGILSIIGLGFIGNILGGVGMVFLGILTTNLFTGEQLEPAFDVLSHALMVLGLPLFLIALLVVLFTRL